MVDLTDARYIDSVGVSLLFELAERLAGRQLRFAVVMPDEGLVVRVLTIVNLDSVAEVHRRLDDALAAIARRLARHRRRQAPDSSAGIQSGRPPPSSSDGSPRRPSRAAAGRRCPLASASGPSVQTPPAPARAASLPFGKDT